MCLWFQSSYCISCGSKIGENTKFSPYRCSVCFWLLFIRTFDRHRHRLYKHNDLSPEHFLDSIYRYDNWANWYHSEYYSVCPVGIFPAAAVQEISSHEDGCIDWLSVFFGCWNCPDVWLGFFRHQWLDDKYRWSLYWILVYCLLSRILPANLKKQLQSSRVNAVAEVLLFAICTFAIMVTAQTWFVHDVLNVP